MGTEEKNILMAHVCHPATIKRIKAVIDGTDAIASEMHLVITPDGISLREFDVSKACLIMWEMTKESFAFYEYDHSEDEITICVDSRSVKRAVKTATERLEFRLDKTKEEGGRLIIVGKSDFNHEERIGLLTPMDADKRPKKPSLPEPDVRYSVVGKLFKKVLLTASKVGSHMRMTVDSDKMTIHTINVDDDEYRAELESDHYSCDFVVEYAKGKSTCLYAMNYMFEFRRFMLNHDVIHVEFTTNKPVTMTLDENGVFVTLILAPRIDRAENGLARARRGEI